jgi:hypothetical protein
MKGPRSKYRIGRAFELEVMEMFKEAGYDVCLATMSKGKYDLIAVIEDFNTMRLFNHGFERQECKDFDMVFVRKTPTHMQKIYLDLIYNTMPCMRWAYCMQCKTYSRRLKSPAKKAGSVTLNKEDC